MAEVDIRTLGKKTPNKKVLKNKAPESSKTIPLDHTKVQPPLKPGQRRPRGRPATRNNRRRKKRA